MAAFAKSPGAPTKFNYWRARRIVKAIRNGVSLVHAALAEGVCTSAINRWRRKGKQHWMQGLDTEFSSFFLAIRRAAVRGQVRNAQIVWNAARSDWKPAAWLLERKFPNEWGRKTAVAVVGKMSVDTTVHPALGGAGGTQLKSVEELVAENQAILAEMRRLGHIPEANGQAGDGNGVVQ
jgi:hypothetical protein